jgi:hypothetical protein
MLNSEEKTMSHHPVLAAYTGSKEKLVVQGGLHYLRGNSLPHFSITAIGFEKNRRNSRWVESFGGCCHDEILKRFPQFADLVSLHLSDNDGVPMHALENGFYHLGGSWGRPDLKVAAEHFRISEDEARNLIMLFGDEFSLTGGFLGKGYAEEAKKKLAAWVDSQRPRWKQEALACITAHHLTVYGDSWGEAA